MSSIHPFDSDSPSFHDCKFTVIMPASRYGYIEYFFDDFDEYCKFVGAMLAQDKIIESVKVEPRSA